MTVCRFDDAPVDPADAIVVARDLGMTTILVGAKDPDATHTRIGALAELPAAVS